MHQNDSYDIELLLNRIAEGDDDAFRVLFERYKERFYATAFKMTHSESQAGEIVQEVFISIWIKRKLIAEAEKPEGYLYTILQNCVYAHFRNMIRERQLKMKMADEEKREESVEIRLIEKEKRSILDGVISRLPPQQRLIYQLAKQDGISREEIARRLRISPNTVRNHLAAAVGFLRAWMETHESALVWTILCLSFYHF